MWKKIVLLGAGGVAESLLADFVKRGNHPVAIYNRTVEKASALAERYSPSTPVVDTLDDLPLDADYYFFALSDTAISLVAEEMPKTLGVWLHTAAVVPIETLSVHHANAAIFYPFNTFSPGIKVSLKETPIFTEAASDEAQEAITEIAQMLSASVQASTPSQRGCLHIAGVLSCNFVNRLFALTANLLKKEHLSFDVVRPLIAETCRKSLIEEPSRVQTGPARRHDRETMETHRKLLALHSPELTELYELLSQSIWDAYPDPFITD